jgi:hypothetical protein
VALESCVVLEAVVVEVVVEVVAVAAVVVWVEMLCASISLELAIRIRHLLRR